MAGRKRAAPEDTSVGKRETRSSKVAKTEGTKTAGRAAKGTARLKTSMAQSTFKSRAMPLYVNITTTAPSLEDQGADPGFLTSTDLIPTTFQTRSFGWKGHKRMMVELPRGDGEGEGEKVHVILTINATVIGSKDVKEGEEQEGEREGHAPEEASGEVGESKQEQPSPGGGAQEEEGEDIPPAGEEHTEESAS